MYQNNYDSRDQYGYQPAAPDPRTLTYTVSGTMKRVYFKMTLGLIVSALAALYCATSTAFMHYYLTHSSLMWVLIIAEFGLVFSISGGIRRMSSPMATMLFYVFAVVNGLMLSTIFLVYSPSAIVKTFFITAGTFGAMSVYGYFTSTDLSKFGSFLFMALIGLVIASLVNIFVHSSTFDWIISIAGVFIFVGLTAWDTQQIKTMAMMTPGDSLGRLSTLGALTLYLDFINLFIFLLRIFGGNRD